MPKYLLYSLYAANQAFIDSGMSLSHRDPERFGTSVGVGMGPLDLIGDGQMALTEKGTRRVSPHFIPRILPNMAAGHVSIRFGLSGPLLSPSSACATGAHAIGDAFRVIQRGEADVMVAGGVEAAVNLLSMAGFDRAKALSSNFNHDPTSSSRPFDTSRDGFVISEGAGMLILEDLDAAKRRSANIYAEIVGYGCSGDAHHITASDAEGRGAQSAMKRAIKDAGIAPSDVSFVNAHATSTPIGDSAEAKAISKIFSKNIIVSANKGCLGHTLGAAGAIESIFTILSLHHGFLPPNVNISNPDPSATSLNLLPTAMNGNFTYAIKNSFGFGGTNVSLCFKHYP